MKTVLILGAGFAGLELATRLSEELPGEVEVTIIDGSDAFVFGFSKLDLMFGRSDLASVRLPYANLKKPGVTFRQETITSIDPVSRQVTTNASTYQADILVVALGADLDPAATPGLVEEGTEYYSVEGANRVRSVLPAFEGGDAIIGVLGPFFKCPAAPFETAIMLHDFLEKNGRRSASTIKVISPMPKPIPISDEASAGILKALEERDIGWWPQSKITALDPATKTATLADDRTIPYALVLGIPVHKAPSVLDQSGLLEEDGWIAVDHTTFATKFENVLRRGRRHQRPGATSRCDCRGRGAHPGRCPGPPDPRWSGARAVQGHCDLLHRVRWSQGGTVRGQLPGRPHAVRDFHRGF